MSDAGWLRGLVVVALIAAACSSLRTDATKLPEPQAAAAGSFAAVPPVDGKPAAASAESGFRLLVDSVGALMSRISLADRARRTIDLQYYIYDDDATGRLVAERLLGAADRGVRVRVLLDDLDAGNAQQLIDALDVHPNIEVRLFNPFLTRNPSLISKIGQFAVDGRRLNRRMHNKSFIVDGSVAIVGGRNIGDAYFDADENLRFRDLDLIAIGPVVADVARAFDIYWNCDAAYPVTAFSSTSATAEDLAALRGQLARDARAFDPDDYARALPDFPREASADRDKAWFWGKAVLLADAPEKAEPGKDDRAGAPALRMQPEIDALITGARKDVLVISSYFVPGDEGTRYFTDLAARGVGVKLLTNSLASSDAPAVHAGYSRYRRRLIEGGVEIYELRPSSAHAPEARGSSPGGSTTQGSASRGPSTGAVSLHAKAMVVDDRYVFVGSMNMDARSKVLNTEMGVVVDSPAMATATAAYFARATAPRNAFRVVVDRSSGGAGSLQWRAVDERGDAIKYDDEPEASIWRRIEISLLSLLPIDGLL